MCVCVCFLVREKQLVCVWHTSMDGYIDPDMTRLVLDNVPKEWNDSELKKQVLEQLEKYKAEEMERNDNEQPEWWREQWETGLKEAKTTKLAKGGYVLELKRGLRILLQKVLRVTGWRKKHSINIRGTKTERLTGKSFMIRGWTAGMVEAQVAYELEDECDVKVVEVRLFKARVDGGAQSALVTVEDCKTVRGWSEKDRSIWIRGRDQQVTKWMKVKKCFNCGGMDHVKADCKHKQPRCSKCGQFGHLKVKCTVEEEGRGCTYCGAANTK